MTSSVLYAHLHCALTVPVHTYVIDRSVDVKTVMGSEQRTFPAPPASDACSVATVIVVLSVHL
jgi:hypothetical protein